MNPKVTSANVISWIEAYCVVPEGKLVGQPIRLAPFQREFIELIYDNPVGTRRAILSMGRKSAKTTLSACLLLNHLCGPSARDRPNSQLYSAAQSRDQAGILFALAVKMIRMNPVLMSAVKIQETAKSLICAGLGTRYRALSAEAHTAHGLSPQFCVHDELGRVRGPRSELYEALETATAAVESPLSLVISTQAPSDSDLLSILIDDALGGHDPQTVIRLHSAPTELDAFSEEAVREANPGYDYFMNRPEVMSMAATAKRMPAREMEFRNLVLNQRVDISSPFLSVDVWKACGAPPGDLIGCQVYAGLDLSSTRDLTALVLAGCDPLTGVWHVLPFFYLPTEGLLERARTDRVPYDRWVEDGYIELTPGATVSYEFLAHRLLELVDDYAVRRIAFDRHNMSHLKPWLLKAGFSEQTFAEKFLEFGQGFRSMSPALRDLEGLLFERKIKHGMNPVLSMCIANSTVTSDPAGSRKLDKLRARGRIDGAIALLMAVACAPATMTKIVDVASLIG